MSAVDQIYHERERSQVSRIEALERRLEDMIARIQKLEPGRSDMQGPTGVAVPHKGEIR